MAIGRLRLKEKGYDFPPFRPPSEAYSLLLRVTRGCPWNKCLFCSMYKETSFEVRTSEEIKSDIMTAANLYGGVARKAFIGDSNSLTVKTDFLIEVLRFLYQFFPNLERVTSYARAKTIVKKKLEELKELRRAGLIRLHVGLETGDSEILRFIKKGTTSEEMIEGGLKAKEAGLEVSFYVLLGIGGTQRWREHADSTVAVLNIVDPHFVRVRTLIPLPGSPLFEMQRRGEFTLSPPDVILKEEQRIIRGLKVTSLFLSDHISNYLPLNGKMPEDKKSLLQTLRRELLRLQDDISKIENYRNKELLRYFKYCGG